MWQPHVPKIRPPAKHHCQGHCVAMPTEILVMVSGRVPGCAEHGSGNQVAAARGCANPDFGRCASLNPGRSPTRPSVTQCEPSLPDTRTVGERVEREPPGSCKAPSAPCGNPAPPPSPDTRSATSPVLSTTVFLDDGSFWNVP